MDNNITDLTDKQIKFIDAYFKYNDVNAVCKALNIKRPTYYTYLKNENVKQEIDTRLIEMLRGTTSFMQNNLNECSKELMQIIRDKKTPPQTRVNAINSFFTNSLKLTEQVDVLQKISEIEDKIENQKTNGGNGILYDLTEAIKENNKLMNGGNEDV